MPIVNISREWLKWHVDLAKRIATEYNEPGEFDGLIKTVGLPAVLLYVDQKYLQKIGVNLTLAESVDITIEFDD